MNLALPPNIEHIITGWAAERGVTLEKVITDAVALELEIRQTLQTGERFLVQKPGSRKLHYVEFLFGGGS